MDRTAQPKHLRTLMEQAQQRAELIRGRIAWVDERRRELWRRMDELEAATGRVGSRFSARAEAAEIDPVPVYPLG
ncbi:MAG: hypothetical protein ACJ8GN_19695 [Longimicrobiaceae bacterium]